MIRNYLLFARTKQLKYLKKKMLSTKSSSPFDMPEDTISLSVGAPGSKTREKCAELINIATNDRMTSESKSGAHLLKYGDPAGDSQFRKELAIFLTKNYGENVKEDNLVATAGASSGLLYLLNILFPNKCPVLCEELTYHIAIEVFHGLQFPLHGVEFDSDGIVPDDLQRKCEALLQSTKKSDNKFNGLLYLIPTYHNPTGRVLSPVRCPLVVQLARKYKLLVICDDVYNILHYADTPCPRRLFSYDSESDADYYGNIVSNGSFSKLLSPGIRCGWMEIPVWIKEEWTHSALLDSGGCLNMHMSGVVGSALRLGLVDSFVNQIKVEHKKRLHACVETLENNLPAGCKFEIPQGGYFIWIQLPDSLNSVQLAKKSADTYKIVFVPGSKFCVNAELPRKYDNCIRIAFSFYEAEVLQKALIKICQLIKEL